MASRHPLPYAYARAHTVLLEDEGDRLVLWAPETVSLSALAEVLRLYDVDALEREAASTLANRIAVAYAGSELKGYGNLVLIRHPNGYVSAYAHNGELKVKRGDTVKRGQVVANSGQTGNVSSPQLHFELRKGKEPVDPTRHLPPLQG